MQEFIYSLKKRKRKRNYSLLLQRRSKKSYKLPYMEDFEANVEVSEEKMLCQLKCTRLEYNDLYAPSQGFQHVDLYETASEFF
jgi:hypothetical protein